MCLIFCYSLNKYLINRVYSNVFPRNVTLLLSQTTVYLVILTTYFSIFHFFMLILINDNCLH